MEPLKEVREAVAVDLGALLDAGDGAVVTLVAGETQLAAHRAVLADRSPVLAAMFSHDTLEANRGLVTIPDIEGPVLRQMLVYLYTLQAPQLPDMAPELLAAADKYGLLGLKSACERHVAAQLSVETAVATAVLALGHSCAGLQLAAVAFIKAHTHQVMVTQGWRDAVLSDPHPVVEFTHLVGEASSEIGSLSGLKKGRRLMTAAQGGKIERLQSLLVAGADVEARDGGRQTALHWAAWWGQLDVVRCLLDIGAQVAARRTNRATPLHFAAVKGRAAMVRLLVTHGADPNAVGDDGDTPLHNAAMQGHTAAAAALLEAGSDRGVTNNLGQTPLDAARAENEQDMVAVLS